MICDNGYLPDKLVLAFAIVPHLPLLRERELGAQCPAMAGRYLLFTFKALYHNRLDKVSHGELKKYQSDIISSLMSGERKVCLQLNKLSEIK